MVLGSQRGDDPQIENHCFLPSTSVKLCGSLRSSSHFPFQSTLFLLSGLSTFYGSAYTSLALSFVAATLLGNPLDTFISSTAMVF